MQKIRELVLPGIERQGQIEAWIVDDTRFYEEGHAFGRRRATILWAARQTGQLSSCGYVVDRQSFGKPADRLPALSAGDMGK